LYTLMKEFRVEATNGALSFQMTAVKTSGFTITDAQPGYETYARAEIAGRLTNEVASGLVSFVIGADFTDSSGNAMAEAFRLPLVK